MLYFNFQKNKLCQREKEGKMGERKKMKSGKNSYIIETSVANYTGKEQARKRSKINTYDRRLGYARTASATPFMKHRGLEEVVVVVVVSDCILTCTSLVLAPRNIISPIAHRHQVAISWSRHVHNGGQSASISLIAIKVTLFAVRRAPCIPGQIVSRPLSPPLSHVAKISPFLSHPYIL